MTRAKKNAELLAELVRHLTGFEMRPGVVRGQLAGDGMVATIEVRIEREVGAQLRDDLCAGALALAEREPWRVCRCQALMAKRSRFGVAPDCRKPVTMVRAFVSGLDLRQDRPHHFQFLCSAHAKQARPTGDRTMATLVLPKQKLDELRARAEREREERWRADEAERVARGEKP